MANIENTNSNNDINPIDLSQLSPEEQAALDRMLKRTERLRYVYQDKVQELAEDGARNGFWIHMSKDYKEIGGGKYLNPITQKEELVTKKRLWEKDRFYYQGQMTTEEYNQFATFRGKMLKEQDTETSEDMTTRLYEYGAMKFLDMNHDIYVRAKKDEIRMAVDACLHISSWNGQIGGLDDYNDNDNDEVSMNPVERDRIEEEEDNPEVPRPKPGDKYITTTSSSSSSSTHKPKQQKVSSYYKPPDEE